MIEGNVWPLLRNFLYPSIQTYSVMYVVPIDRFCNASTVVFSADPCTDAAMLSIAVFTPARTVSNALIVRDLLWAIGTVVEMVREWSAVGWRHSAEDVAIFIVTRRQMAVAVGNRCDGRGGDWIKDV